jgi:chromosome partitioning protein
MAEKCAIANQKGGVGKTTTTVNLAYGLTQKGKKVLAVDLDPQGNLTTSFGIDTENLKMTLADAMLEKINKDRLLDPKEYILNVNGVDIIPSDVALSGVELALVNTMSREYILKEILDSLSDNYDYIFIDCSPSLGMLTVNGLTAADSVIIPVQSQYLSLKGLEQLLQTISRIKRQINKSLKIEGLLLTMYNKQTNLSKKVKESLEISYGAHIKIFKSLIPLSVKAAEAPIDGKSILEYAPENMVSLAYKNFIGEITNGSEQ